MENPPQMNGRFLSMVLIPNREAVEAARKLIEEEEKKEAAELAASEEGGDAKKESPATGSPAAES